MEFIEDLAIILKDTLHIPLLGEKTHVHIMKEWEDEVSTIRVVEGSLPSYRPFPWGGVWEDAALSPYLPPPSVPLPLSLSLYIYIYFHIIYIYIHI